MHKKNEKDFYTIPSQETSVGLLAGQLLNILETFALFLYTNFSP